MTNKEFKKIVNEFLKMSEIECIPNAKYLILAINDIYYFLFNYTVKVHFVKIMYLYAKEALKLLVDISDINIVVRIRNILSNKAKEYAQNDDRLHNFKHAAILSTEQPDTICLMFMLKHLVSMNDIVNNPKKFSDDIILEKFIDFMNYCILLTAIVEEGKNENKNK